MYFVAGFKVIVYKSFGELTPGMHVWVEECLNLELFNHGVEKSGVDMVVKVFIHFPLYLATLGLTLWFVLILNSSHKILCDSSIMIKKASIYTMNALNKSSELWHTY